MVEISVQEAALYDRQIRLWGMDAQNRMRATHILIIGMNGLANEVIKNLVLAGIGSLTVLSDAQVSSVGCQFFSREDDTGYKLDHSLQRIQALNPSVKVTADTRSWKTLDSDYFKVFQIILLCSGDQYDMIKMNGICKMHKIKFLCSRLDGFYGFIFSDLGKGFKFKRQGDSDYKTIDFVDWREVTKYTWDCRQLKGKALKKFKRNVSSVYFLYSLLWRCLECKVDLDDLDGILQIKKNLMLDFGVDEIFLSTEMIQDFFRMIGTEIAPSAAMLGGILAQEILKIVAENEMPITNYYGFDAQDPSGIVMCLLKE